MYLFTRSFTKKMEKLLKKVLKIIFFLNIDLILLKILLLAKRNFIYLPLFRLNILKNSYVFFTFL